MLPFLFLLVIFLKISVWIIFFLNMLLCRYEVITTPTDIIMVMEYAGGELFNFIVERGKVNFH